LDFSIAFRIFQPLLAARSPACSQSAGPCKLRPNRWSARCYGFLDKWPARV